LKRINQIMVLCLISILAFVLPVAVLAGKEGKIEEKEKVQQMITVKEFERNIDCDTSEIDEKESIGVYTAKEADDYSQADQKNGLVFQDNVLIKEKNDLINGLEEAEFRLKQFEIEYKAALSSGDLAEIDRLSYDITIEKSNIAVMKILLKKTIEEMYRAEVYNTSNI